MIEKGTNTTQEERTVSSTNSTGKTGKSTCTRMSMDHYLTSYTNSNSKCIKDLNIRPVTSKL